MIVQGKLSKTQLNAINHFAELLFTPQMNRHIRINFKFRQKFDWLGLVSIDDYNESGKPREFLVEINSKQSQEEIIKTIAHEMVHVKQYVYGELNEQGTMWFNVVYNVDYEEQPWEIEAHDLTDYLYYNWKSNGCIASA
jgi:hypothetical protein